MIKIVRSLLPALAFLLLVPSSTPALAKQDHWSLRLEPVFVDVGGHDPQLVDTESGTVNLETDSGVGYHFELRHDRRQRWGLGRRSVLVHRRSDRESADRLRRSR